MDRIARSWSTFTRVSGVQPDVESQVPPVVASDRTLLVIEVCGALALHSPAGVALPRVVVGTGVLDVVLRTAARATNLDGVRAESGRRGATILHVRHLITSSGVSI